MSPPRDIAAVNSDIRAFVVGSVPSPFQRLVDQRTKSRIGLLNFVQDRVHGASICGVSPRLRSLVLRDFSSLL